MLQSELNSAWTETLAYYYFMVTGLFSSVPLGTWSYDANYNLQIDTWTAGCDQPTIEQLLAYDLATVLSFYSAGYILPQQIQAGFSLAKMSTEALSSIPAGALTSMQGYQVFDTTTRVVRWWSGSAWV